MSLFDLQSLDLSPDCTSQALRIVMTEPAKPYQSLLEKAVQNPRACLLTTTMMTVCIFPISLGVCTHSGGIIAPIVAPKTKRKILEDEVPVTSDKKRRKVDKSEPDSAPAKPFSKLKTKPKPIPASQNDSDDDNVPLATTRRGKKSPAASRQGTVGLLYLRKSDYMLNNPVGRQSSSSKRPRDLEEATPDVDVDDIPPPPKRPAIRKQPSGVEKIKRGGGEAAELQQVAPQDDVVELDTQDDSGADDVKVPSSFCS